MVPYAPMPGPRLFAVIAVASLTCAGCRDKSAAREQVIVFAAASLGDSFAALEDAYEDEHPEVDVVINLAGSQLLATQLLEGAAADVFASADVPTLERVLAERPAAPGTRRTFASNVLVLVVPAGSEIDSFEEIEQLLAKPETKAILAAPEVPIGRYARTALDQIGLREPFEARLVSNEDSVDGVIAKLELGECDVGIAYATDLRRSPNLSGVALPDNIDVTARYELAVLADGPSPDRGQAFVEFVTGPAGQAILRAHGFREP